MKADVEQFRPLLFSVAYNITGVVADAEDLVQEAFLKFYQTQESTSIQNPKGYLIRSITNLAINHYERANVQRETYPGVWLPEPLADDDSPKGFNQETILEYSMLALMEKLSPYERAVFILRAILDFDHGSIAEFIGVSEANSRKIYSRAQSKLPKEAPENYAKAQYQDLMAAMMKALNEGDFEALKQCFSEDIALYSDGGGEKAAAMKPVLQPEYVARFLRGIARLQIQDVDIQWLKVNGETAAGIYLNGELDGIWIMKMEKGVIQKIFIQRSPDKLPSS